MWHLFIQPFASVCATVRLMSSTFKRCIVIVNAAGAGTQTHKTLLTHTTHSINKNQTVPANCNSNKFSRAASVSHFVNALSQHYAAAK